MCGFRYRVGRGAMGWVMGIAGLGLTALAGCAPSTAKPETGEKPAQKVPFTVEFIVESATEKEMSGIQEAVGKIQSVAKVETGGKGKVTVLLKADEPLTLYELRKAVEGVPHDPSGRGFRFDPRSLTPSGPTHFGEGGLQMGDKQAASFVNTVANKTGFRLEWRINYALEFRLTPKGSKPIPLADFFDLPEVAKSRFDMVWNDPG